MINLPRKHLAALRKAHPAVHLTADAVTIDGVDVSALCELATDAGAMQADFASPLTVDELLMHVGELVEEKRDGVVTLMHLKKDGVHLSKRKQPRA